VSRTVRRMPMKKDRNLRNTKPDYSSIRILYHYPIAKNNWGIISLTSAKFRTIKRKETREEKEKEFEEKILKFARKNGISVRRRQHTTRDIKRQLLKELNEI
jgi:hypothetical protein